MAYVMYKLWLALSGQFFWWSDNSNVNSLPQYSLSQYIASKTERLTRYIQPLDLRQLTPHLVRMIWVDYSGALHGLPPLLWCLPSDFWGANERRTLDIYVFHCQRFHDDYVRIKMQD